MFVYYFVVIFLVPILLKSKKYKTLTISVIFALTFLFLNFDFNKNLKITFLNVGLGDCVLLQQKNNNILIDTGDSIQTAMYKISSYLKKQGVFTIHHLVITHPHYPHYGGTELLIDNFKIENVYLNEFIPPDNHEYQDLINKIRQKNINLFFVNKIKKLKLQNTEVLFIPNYTNYFYNEESFYDGNSIFVKIRQNNFSIILTNDIPARYLKDKNNLLFLQFPRHGKYKEDIIELENLTIKPKFLVVSTDKHIPELKKIKIPVYTTVDDGDITIDVEKLKLRKIKRTTQGVKIYM
jgi:beta-lactamase superfamily II metal-dependent hydrolase